MRRINAIVAISFVSLLRDFRAKVVHFFEIRKKKREKYSQRKLRARDKTLLNNRVWIGEEIDAHGHGGRELRIEIII